MDEGAGASRGALAKKIAEVQKKVEAVPKRGHAEVQTRGGAKYTYDYIQESDLMAAIRPELAGSGVATFYSDRVADWKIGQDGTMTAIVEVALTLVDGDSGEEFEMRAQGVGTDKGDKAVNKAKTSAMRYLLWKWFILPSDIDPEQENVERQPRPAAAPATVEYAPEEEVVAFLDEVEAAGLDRARAEGPLRDEEGRVEKRALARSRSDFQDYQRGREQAATPA